MILAATGNKCQMDLVVEVAMKIQFPKDEIRNHDDRTGKYNNNILVRADNVEEDQLTGDIEVPDSSGDDLDVLATDQEEVEALMSLATVNRTLREARAKQHQVRMARRFLSSTTVTSRPQQRETGTDACLLRRITLCLTMSREARKDSRKEGRCDRTRGTQ